MLRWQTTRICGCGYPANASKQTQALPAAFHRFGRKVVVVVQTPRPDAPLRFIRVSLMFPAASRTTSQHMKTIGTEINGGIQRGGIHTLHPSTRIRATSTLPKLIGDLFSAALIQAK